MSVRMAAPQHPSIFRLDELEKRQFLAADLAADAESWDLNSPAQGEIATRGELDYFSFQAAAGDKYVFTSSGLKNFTILDSDGATKLDHLLIYDGMLNPTPGRLVWTAPHAGTYFMQVSGYSAFLIDVPTGSYAVSAFAVSAPGVPTSFTPAIEFDEPATDVLANPGDIDFYRFNATVGTIYRFEILSTDHAEHVLQIVEAPIRQNAPSQPSSPAEAYAGDNLIATNQDGQRGLSTSMQWLAPASGTYHISIAPLSAASASSYTLRLSAGPVVCDPNTDSPPPAAAAVTTTSRVAKSKKLTPSAKHKAKLHHRRPANHKREVTKRKTPLAQKASKLHKLHTFHRTLKRG